MRSTLESPPLEGAPLVAILALISSAWCCGQNAQPLPELSPQQAGFSTVKLAEVDGVIETALKAGAAKGAVLLVGRDGAVIYRKAYGVHSEGRPMTPDAIFDCASLTKPVATASSIMKLVETGKVALDDPVCRYLPGFRGHGKETITIEQLLRHRGGLLPDNALADYQKGPAVARRRIFDLKLRARPDAKFIYTDVGFIALGWVVEAVSGLPLEAFAARNIFRPLGMRDTDFHALERRLDAGRRERCAPTEPARKGEPPLQGIIHDPRSRLLGGVAGHAGLFSTADDLARFCAMLLAEGTLGRERVFAAETVAALRDFGDLPPKQRRGLGWDVATGYSKPRGHHFPLGSFGHTGFTGTSLWMDPASGTFVILLTSRLYPDGEGDVRALRGEVADVVATALRDAPWPLEGAPKAARVRTGLDRVANGEVPEALRGQRIGLITNHTGQTRDRRRGIDVFHALTEVDLVRLFSPEHGIEGKLDARVGHATDRKTKLPIYSLYGETRKPTPEMLAGLDALVFDIQDIGCRFYTYISTMLEAMEAASEAQLRFVVLDRPNVIGGDLVEGPIADRQSLDFVGCWPIPVRHGMTVGELALMLRAEASLDLDLHVIEMQGWRRGLDFDSCGLPWVNTSPNMRSVTEAILYPGIGLLETTNLSVGRGTDTPFEHIGAPWLDGKRLARALTALDLSGIRFAPVRFTPNASKFKGEVCSGVRFELTDRITFRPVRTGLHLAAALHRLHPKQWQTRRFDRLLKNRATFDALLAGQPVPDIIASWAPAFRDFLKRRRRYLLYDR